VTEVLPIKDLNALKDAIYVHNLALWAASGVNDSWQLAARGGSSVMQCGSVKGAGHSFVLLGYHDDPKAPGGGYVVIKNSWGKSWGFFGYGFLPYACVTGADKNFPLEAHALKWCVAGENGCPTRPDPPRT
jgi:hypothetical protein